MVVWETHNLGDFAEIKGGKRLPLGNQLTPEKNDHPYIRVRDIANRTVPKDNLLYVPDDVFPSISRYIVNTDDLIISIVGTIGLVSIIDGGLNNASLTENCAKIIYDKERIHRDFLYYFLISGQGQEEIRKGTVGSTQPKLPFYNIQKIQLPIPPVEEQKAIAKILSSLDDKIELNRRMNATLEAMARALFKVWFVDFEPVHANKENRPSTSASPEIAKLFPSNFENGIPKGWRIGTLLEIATNYRQNIDPTEIEANTPYVGLEHIPRKSLALTEWGLASKAESTKSNFGTNDILFGKLRPYFHKVVIAPIDGICSTDILVVRPKQEHHFGQVAIQFSSDSLIQYATQLSNGAKMPRTSWADLAKFETVIPSREISESYTKFVSRITKRILTNISEGRVLEEIRDSLLPRLISGRINVQVHNHAAKD
jgi:type I restriction enzyme, S subunit